VLTEIYISPVSYM